MKVFFWGGEVDLNIKFNDLFDLVKIKKFANEAKLYHNKIEHISGFIGCSG
jgi:hypothetical protein